MKSKIVLSLILCLCFLNVRAQITGNGYTCIGSTTSFSDGYSTVPIGSSWYSGSPGVATIDISTGMLTGVSAGTTIITYTNGSASDYLTVFVGGLSVSCSPSTICAGGTFNFTSTQSYIDLNYTYTYSWSGPNSFSSTVTDPVLSGATAAASGTYTLTVDNVTSGCTSTATVTATVDVPSVTASVSPSLVCGGGSFTLSATPSGGTPAYTYAWTGPNTFTSSAASPAVSPAVAASAGSYSLTITDANGCTVNATTSSVTVDVVTVTATNTSPVCTGGTLSLAGTVTGTPGYTYAWSGPSGFTSTVQNPASISHPTVAGTYNYSLTGTDANGCSATSVTVVTVGEPLTMTVSESAPWTITGDKAYTNCSGTMTLVAAGAFSGTYSWTPSTSITPTNSATVTITNTATATYVVTGHYNGCTGTASTPVLVTTTSCTPCNYFTVSYQNSSASCTGCTTTQPFHTIDAATITSANVPTDGDNNIYFAYPATIIMTGTINWSNNVMFMAGGSTVNIGTTTVAANVSFSNCHLFSCGWYGIGVVVNSTVASQVSLNNNTLVENANDGVQIYSGTGPAAPSSGNILNCNGAIFNNNSTSLYITYYPPTTYTVTGSTTLPFSITGNVFTGRNFTPYNDGTTTPSHYYPFSWPSAVVLSSVTATDPYTPTYGVNSYSATTTPLNGIIINGGLTTTSGATNTYYELVVGDNTTASNLNLFDNMNQYGITAGGNISIYNNVFMNFRYVESCGNIF